jgi:hypothetical protein
MPRVGSLLPGLNSDEPVICRLLSGSLHLDVIERKAFGLDVIEGNTFGQELLERSGDLLEVTQEA